jgi:hypothetical protein
VQRRVTGWASAPYLVTDAGGKPTNLQVSGAQLGIPIVVPTGVAAVVATPPVGAMVAVPTTAVVQPILPAPEVLSHVTQQVVDPVLVDGESDGWSVLVCGCSGLSHPGVALRLFLR